MRNHRHKERGDIFEYKKNGDENQHEMCRMRKTKRIACFPDPNHALFHAKKRPGGQRST